jgi:hypothetical protein
LPLSAWRIANPGEILPSQGTCHPSRRCSKDSEESSMRVAVSALVLCVALGGCQYIKYPTHGPDAGNPDHDAYAGAPGSAYDRAANPPSDIGLASYNAYAPLANNLPADETLPAPTLAGPAPGAVTAAPLPPMARPPAPRP